MRALIFIAMLLMFSTVEAATPNCIVLEFSDDTRYDQVNITKRLSYFVAKNLLNSGKFSMSAPYAIDADLSAGLYDEKARGYSMMKEAIEKNDFDELFESMNDESKAQSIATAQVGQIINPELTSAIGRRNKAEYLIQGTVINVGVGNWWREDYSDMSRAINMASSFTDSTDAIGMNGSMSSPIRLDVKKTGIGVQCDVRLIKASSGEVVWSKRVVGLGTQKMVNTGIVTFGKKKLNENLLETALKNAGEKVVAALVNDLDAGKLFLR